VGGAAALSLSLRKTPSTPSVNPRGHPAQPNAGFARQNEVPAGTFLIGAPM
jgi:hypothetical protein